MTDLFDYFYIDFWGDSTPWLLAFTSLSKIIGSFMSWLQEAFVASGLSIWLTCLLEDDLLADY